MQAYWDVSGSGNSVGEKKDILGGVKNKEEVVLSRFWKLWDGGY